MATLFAALICLGILVALGVLPPATRTLNRATLSRWGLVALLLLLPLLHAFSVLTGARSRLDGYLFEYVGKEISFGEGQPLTVGGSPEDSEEVEDLRVRGLQPQAMRVEPLPAEAPEPAAGAPSDPAQTSPALAADVPAAAVLRLASPAPAVHVDGELLNSVPLESGDRIAVERPGSEPVLLTYLGDRLEVGEESFSLGARFLGRFTAGTRVHELERIGDRTKARMPGVYSFLWRPSSFGPWHLVIRSREVSVERGGETVAAFVELFPVPASFELSTSIVRGGSLRLRRQDELRLGEGKAEVRFGSPQTSSVVLDPDQAETRLALAVPSALSRLEIIELGEHSPRFRGLAAQFRHQKVEDRATLSYAGDEREIEAGRIYALGTGADRLLLRVDRHRYPRGLLLDLALLALFLGIFLGRGMVAHYGLAAVVGPTALLLGHRLLFTYRVAVRPPDFAIEPLQEARFALWLIPAFLLAAWALAWRMRRSVEAAADGWSERGRRLLWPLLGLVVASVGCFVVSDGVSSGRRSLALLPVLLGMALLLVDVAVERWPSWRRRLSALQRSGVPWVWGRWTLLVLVGLGAVILVVRLGFAALGMKEVLRLFDFRLLWTVLQLPLAALVVGLAVYALSREPEAGERQASGSRLLGLLGLLAFLLLVFPGVAFAVGDLGLALAHSWAPILALLCVAAAPWVSGGLSGASGGWGRLSGGARVGVSLLAALPLVAALLLNAYPEMLIRYFGWDLEAGEAGEAPPSLGANREQQLFRLFMLANPERLPEQGLKAADRVAIHYFTLQGSARQGFDGDTGFLTSVLPDDLGDTYLSDLVPMAFVLADFGHFGLIGVALLYLALLAAFPLTARAVDPDDRLGGQGLSVALVALLAVAMPSMFMILANLNLVLFTGKNMALLSLNSISDVFQAGLLLSLAVFGLGLRKGVT